MTHNLSIHKTNDALKGVEESLWRNVEGSKLWTRLEGFFEHVCRPLPITELD